MTAQIYDKATTALLFIDPYNDFLSEGGKLWPRVKDVANEVGLLDNLRPSRAPCAVPASRSSSCPIAAGSRATLKPGAIPAQASFPS